LQYLIFLKLNKTSFSRYKLKATIHHKEGHFTSTFIGANNEYYHFDDRLGIRQGRPCTDLVEYGIYTRIFTFWLFFLLFFFIFQLTCIFLCSVYHTQNKYDYSWKLLFLKKWNDQTGKERKLTDRSNRKGKKIDGQVKQKRNENWRTGKQKRKNRPKISAKNQREWWV